MYPDPLPHFADAAALEPSLRLLAKAMGGLDFDKNTEYFIASVAPQWLGHFHDVHAIAMEAYRVFFIDPKKMTGDFLLRVAL
jgi:hypothetical protein